MNSTLSVEEFKAHLLADSPLIDVRAPVEFAGGSIPNSVNLPILDNDERALIGTCYKQHGPEKAVALGFRLVAGENKERKLQGWKNFIQTHPNTILTCFRGGKRSQITQQFLKEVGFEVPRVEKGYKQIRQFLIDQVKNFSEVQSMLVLSGLTGSAKTHLLQRVQSFYPALDLEKLANHRGSAFGSMGQQPTQADFENLLASQILKIQNTGDPRPVLCEDESRLIGQVHMTEEFFQNLRRSKVILVRQSLEQRIENIFKDYITDANLGSPLFEYYEDSLRRIEKRLGGAKKTEILDDLLKSKQDFLERGEVASNKIWIEKLLVNYYDRMYLSSFELRKPDVIFEGNHGEVSEFLRSFVDVR